jgi:hypothetical protein
VKVAEAIQRLRPQVPEGIHLEEDELGHLVAFVRRDMLHLDADALNDRLVAWTRDRLARDLPRALATISFRHARPVDPHDESTMDIQEGWLGLEPSVWIEGPQVSEAEVAALARVMPEFLKLLEGRGRPSGFRRYDEGNAE